MDGVAHIGAAQQAAQWHWSDDLGQDLSDPPRRVVELAGTFQGGKEVRARRVPNGSKTLLLQSSRSSDPVTPGVENDAAHRCPTMDWWHQKHRSRRKSTSWAPDADRLGDALAGTRVGVPSGFIEPARGQDVVLGKLGAEDCPLPLVDRLPWRCPEA